MEDLKKNSTSYFKNFKVPDHPKFVKLDEYQLKWYRIFKKICKVPDGVEWDWFSVCFELDLSNDSTDLLADTFYMPEGRRDMTRIPHPVRLMCFDRVYADDVLDKLPDNLRADVDGHRVGPRVREIQRRPS